MLKQWAFVIAVVLGLVAVAVIVVLYGPQVEPVAVGGRAPNYRVMSLATGDSLALRDHYRGHVTLVNIWATWCEPCKAEMPAIEQLYDSLGPRGFRVASVSIDREGPAVVRDYAAKLKLTFDLLLDQSMKIQEAYQTTGVPESFLLDTNGVIMKRVIGAFDWASPVNTALVLRLMGDSATAIAREAPTGSAGDTARSSRVPAGP